MKKIGALLLIAISVIVSACQPAETDGKQSEIEYLNIPGVESSGLPFSSAVRVDNTLYLSGMIGLEPGALRLAPGGIEAEARQIMEDMKTTLEAFGSSMDRGSQVHRIPGR